MDVDPQLGIPADRLEVVGFLVVAYEAKHYPITSPNPIAVIEFRTEEQGLKHKTCRP